MPTADRRRRVKGEDEVGAAGGRGGGLEWARFLGGGGEKVESKEGGVDPQSAHDRR